MVSSVNANSISGFPFLDDVYFIRDSVIRFTTESITYPPVGTNESTIVAVGNIQSKSAFCDCVLLHARICFVSGRKSSIGKKDRDE